MDYLQIFILGIFFVILSIIFLNQFYNGDKTSCAYLNKEKFSLDNNGVFTSNTYYKENKYYPYGPENYVGYWGFQPYKGLYPYYNPWWKYPYPYPKPTNYEYNSYSNCSSRLN